MVRIKDGNYIAIFYDRMIEVKADSKRDAYNKAKRYFESREHRELFDGELKVCQIPSIIGVLDECEINRKIRIIYGYIWKMFDLDME